MKSLFRRLLGGSDPSPSTSASIPAISAEGRLASDLWVDAPDALDRLEAMERQGDVSTDEAAELDRFIREGYLTFSLGDVDREATAIQADVDRVWRERPADLAYAWSGPLRSFAESDEARDRRPSYRIADLHSHSAAALDLYLSPAIFRRVERILGRPAVATQSLYFQWGSQQALHRDPVFVQTRPPSHLVAAWIALEEIHPASGPLVYVPGSHRLPYYQFAPGEFLFDQSRYGPAEAEAMAEHDRRRCQEAGLATETLLCPKGEVLLWHASLLHGGSAVADPGRTRKSFVVHFSSADRYKLRRQGIVEFLTDGTERIERHRILETEEILERPGARGFQSPMVGYTPPG